MDRISVRVEPAIQPRGAPPPIRFGRIEVALLAVVDRSGGVISRVDAVNAVFPRPSAHDGGAQLSKRPVDRARARANAESAITRAVASLQRKGLLVREANPPAMRQMLRRSDCTRLPEWEEVARGEEDFAEYCRRQAGAWDEFARRSLRRASSMRADRAVERAEDERQADLEEMHRLERRYHAAAADGRRRRLLADMQTGDLGAA